MKTSYFILFVLYSALLNPFESKGQNVGNWNFNGSLTGTGTAHNTVSAAALGSSITTGAYNGGTVYFGEDGWPTGPLDPNAYLQFSLTPASGKHLSLTYLAMEIRRSTTGTPAGSGPTQWSLRSSLDGYASNIASGTLTTNSTPATTVSLPVGFLNVSSTVNFRLYGYSAVITSGGLNRFVYDNISVAGTVILPVSIQDFHATLIDGDATKISWTLNGDESPSAITIEKSYNTSDFHTIRNITPQTGIEQNYSFVDASGNEGHVKAYFRVRWTSQSGTISYSDVQQVNYNVVEYYTAKILPVSPGANVQVLVQTEKSGDFRFSVYSSEGSAMTMKTVSLDRGTQSVTVTDRPLHSGFYVLITEREGRKITSKILIT